MKSDSIPMVMFALGLVGQSVSVHAQELVEYRFLAGLSQTPPGSPTGPAGAFRAAEANVSAGGFDPAADTLLTAAQGFTKGVFNVPSLQLRRAVTQRVPTGAQRGDVLIAEWSFEEPFGSGWIVLTDTPYYSTYAFRTRGCRIRTQADLTAFLRSALVWGNSPVLPNLEAAPASSGVSVGGVSADPFFFITLPAGSGPITFFSGSPSGSPRWALSPYLHVADFEIDGLLEGEEWFFTFGVGKSYTQGLYPVRARIPERFPPLGDLAKSWSFAQVRGEVGRQVKPFVGGADYTADRDQILIAELVRRGLSEAQVLDLLTDVQPTPDAYDRRLAAVDEAFQDAGAAPFIGRFFMPAFRAYQRIGPAATKSVAHLFGLASVPSCQVDVEALALDLLKRGEFIEGPFAYLGSCSTSREALAALQTVSLPAELEWRRQFEVDNIRSRVEHPARGR